MPVNGGCGEYLIASINYFKEAKSCNNGLPTSHVTLNRKPIMNTLNTAQAASDIVVDNQSNEDFPSFFPICQAHIEILYIIITIQA
jgi:hypothetical protein